MKKLITICLIMATMFTVNAQTIKDLKGRAEAINEESLIITANPENKQPSYQEGFMVDFKITIGLQKMYLTSYLIQVNEIKPRVDKGYFYKTTYTKPGKYYNCSELGDLCNQLELSSATIIAIWEYNGKEYKTGAIQLSSQNLNFLNYSTSITKPGGIDMPYEAIKSGEAKVIKIEFVSWHFKNEETISNLLRKKYQ
jgi:hypothetical protein